MVTEDNPSNNRVTRTKVGTSKPENDHSVCDNCHSNFGCSRLYMSLKIVESDLMRMQKSGLNITNAAEKIASIRKKLSDQGWSYPHTSVSCKYANDISEIWKELETVIESTRTIQFG